MPTYEYCCENCGERFDDLCSYEESKQPKTCPVCSHDKCPRTYNTGGKPCLVSIKGVLETNYHDVTSLKAKEKEFVEGAIKGSQEALKAEKGKSPYARRKIPYEQLEKEGTVKRVSEEHKQARIKAGQKVVHEAGKKMTKDEINRAGTRGDAN